MGMWFFNLILLATGTFLVIRDWGWTGLGLALLILYARPESSLWHQRR